MNNQQTRKPHRIVLGLTIIAIAGVAIFPLIPTRTGVVSSQQPAIDAFNSVTACKLRMDDDGRVTHLAARGPEVTDAVAVHLKELTNLQSLQLQQSTISDSTLEVIGGLSQLESLHLHETEITSEGLKHLTGLQNLTELLVPKCRIGDDGLGVLAQIQSLRMLNLSETDVTDQGLKELKALASLETLNLGGTDVNGSGFSDFTVQKKLTHLSLPDTAVNQDGLANLTCFPELQLLYLDRVAIDEEMLVRLMELVTGSFPRLTGLFLSGTPLTDDSTETLTALAGMPELAVVNLNNTLITKPAFKRLATATPQISYIVDYSEGED